MRSHLKAGRGVSSRKESGVKAILVLGIVAPLTLVTSVGTAAPDPFRVVSPAFAHGGIIPATYTCDGPNRSPALLWSGAPAGSQSFALIMDDPDAPGGTFTHWVVFDILGASSELPEGLRPRQVGTSGRNDFGRVGYGGPCPPSGTHRYYFTLFSLDVSSLRLAEGARRVDVERAMQGHVLDRTQLMGRYGR